MPRKVRLHQYAALTVIGFAFKVATVDGRKGWLKLKFSQSEVGWVISSGEVTRRRARPEKTD